MKFTEVIENRNLDLNELVGSKPWSLQWPVLDELVEKAVELLMEVTRVGVLYDVDADGLVSGKEIEEYMMKMGLMVYRKMNDRKKHGITDDVVDWVKEEGIEWLFVVDAGTNDIEKHEALSELGIYVMVLDHHEQWDKKDVENVWIANCSTEEHLPKLSGAGVCYRFIEALDRLLGGKGVKSYEPWVGLTVLSDSCSMTDKENRYYVERLFEHYNDIDLFNAFTYWGSKRNHFLFGVIPFLNACIRTNHGDWAMEAVLMNGSTNLKKFVKDKRKRVLDEQNKIIEGMLETSRAMTGDDIVMLELSEEYFEYSGMSGLLANKVLNKTKKSVLVLYKEGEYYRGSFRGRGDVNDEVLRELGWKVMGHPQAAGIELFLDEQAKEVLKATKNRSGKDKIPDYDFEIGDVDIIRNYDELLKMARFNEMTGGDIETIKFKLNVTRVPFRYQQGKKVEYDFQSFQVRDFNVHRRLEGGWVIEPLLDKNGIVLLRG